MLSRKYRLGISPATVRNELHQLTAEGYLEQPHTSAGRIPTNQGWRFYVENVVMGKPVPQVDIQSPKTFESLAEMVASLCKALGVSMSEDGRIFLSGVSDLFSQPDFETKEQYERLAETIDRIEENSAEMFEGLFPDAPNILIGRENSYLANDDISSMFTTFENGSKAKGLALLIGPKRMPYERNWHILRNLETVAREISLK
jgi:heat-inducible transcriptional repressor